MSLYSQQIEVEEETPEIIPNNGYLKIQHFIWNVLEQEYPTRFGAIVNISLMVMIIINLSLMTIETEPIFDENDFFFILFNGFEIFFTLLFSCELILRNWSSAASQRRDGGCFKKRLRYFFSIWNVIDILSVIPSIVYLSLGFVSLGLSDEIRKDLYYIKDAIFIFRTLRFLRVLRLHYFFNLFGILKKVFVSKWKELLVSVFLMITVVLFFGLFIHVVERKQDPENFGSIPRSFYFVMITLSTIGYGDVVPKTVLGKIIVSICALVPIGLFGIPISVIASGLIEELQTGNKDLHDQLKRFLVNKKRATGSLINLPSPTSSSNLPKIQHRKSTSDIDDLPNIEFKKEKRVSFQNPIVDMKHIVRLLNSDDANYDLPTIQMMLDYGISLKGIFFLNDDSSFDMKRVRQLEGITSVESLMDMIDQNLFSHKDISRILKSIEKMIEYWRKNQLTFKDSKILDSESKKHQTTEQLKDNKTITEEMIKLIKNGTLNLELREFISGEVSKRFVNERFDIFKDVMLVSEEVIEEILNGWRSGSKLFAQEIQSIVDASVVKNISTLPSWGKRIQKLKSNLIIN
jgi:voltage-gated potassium channel